MTKEVIGLESSTGNQNGDFVGVKCAVWIAPFLLSSLGACTRRRESAMNPASPSSFGKLDAVR